MARDGYRLHLLQAIIMLALVVSPLKRISARPVRMAAPNSQSAGDVRSIYQMTTEQRYATEQPHFVGKYQHTRALLDYKWHAHYEPERQHVQDAIADTFLSGGVRVERPWIVYTAGPMGAGKSYTIRYLHKLGAFPLDRFVQIDPDKIKGLLPDMPEYIKYNREMAGSLTHKESGFIAEIIEREAMQQGKPILVDGSLRNSDWYAAAFGRFRAEFPSYRIAILLVQAPAEQIHDRARRRGAVTGRIVPGAVLDDAIANVPASFSTLQPLVDLSAVVTNNDCGSDPHFEPPMTVDKFRDIWDEIAAAPSPAELAGAAGAAHCHGAGQGQGRASLCGHSSVPDKLAGAAEPLSRHGAVDTSMSSLGQQLRRVHTAAQLMASGALDSGCPAVDGRMPWPVDDHTPVEEYEADCGCHSDSDAVEPHDHLEPEAQSCGGAVDPHALSQALAGGDLAGAGAGAAPHRTGETGGHVPSHVGSIDGQHATAAGLVRTAADVAVGAGIDVDASGRGKG